MFRSDSAIRVKMRESNNAKTKLTMSGYSRGILVHCLPASSQITVLHLRLYRPFFFWLWWTLHHANAALSTFPLSVCNYVLSLCQSVSLVLISNFVKNWSCPSSCMLVLLLHERDYLFGWNDRNVLRLRYLYRYERGLRRLLVSEFQPFFLVYIAYSSMLVSFYA